MLDPAVHRRVLVREVIAQGRRELAQTLRVDAVAPYVLADLVEQGPQASMLAAQRVGLAGIR